MRRKSSQLRPALLFVLAGVAALSLPAGAQVADKADASAAAAVAACERAARQTLDKPGAAPFEVSFGAPTVQTSLSNDSQTVLRGTGRWRGAGGVHTFSYSCNVDLHTFEALGLVLRDSTPVVAAAPARAPAEPDLSELSPAACESSAVEALQQRWPRVSKISFGSATRSFHQQSAIRAELHGSGRAMPAPGSPSMLFEFDCAIDPRDGRVLRTSVSG